MGSLKISGSTTGYTYVRKGNDIECYDAKGKKIDKNVFLEAEGLTMNAEGKFVRKGSSTGGTTGSKKTKGKKVNITQEDLQNMQQVGNNYAYKFVNGKVTYYYFDESGFTKISGADFKAKTGGYVKKDGSFITEADAKKASAPKKKLGFWDKAKAFGKGIVKSVTNMFTDENGKFSWKQTLKTVGTAVAVVGIAAVAVAAGICTGGVATAVIVGAGVAMGAGNVIKGAVNLSNAQTDEETLAAYEQMGTGTGEIGMAVLTKRPMASSMKAVSAASKVARMESLASGSGRVVSWAKGVGAGVKTVVPTPKQMYEGVKNGTETAYNAVRHPVRTTRTALQNRRARIQTRESIKGDVETIRTQEDFVAARERVNNSEALTPKQKAKLNKKLDKMNREELPHEDIAALRERANDTSLSATERNAAQKRYNEAIKRSTNREALEEIQNDGVAEFNTLDEAGFRTKVSEADPNVNNDALINSIKKNESLSPEVKSELLAELEGKGVKLSERGRLVEKRITQIDKMQETEFNSLINSAEFKTPSWTRRQWNKIRGKETEYAALEARIKAEVKNPELQAKLLKKLEAKKQLLEDIGNMKEHPEFKEYKDLIKRADDEVSLQMLLDKLSKDHSYFKSPTSKAQRSQLYREIFKKQHKINPDKYPDIEMRLKAKEQENLIKDAEKEIKSIEKDLQKAERQANPERVEAELRSAEQRLNETETALKNELAELRRARGHENATNGTRQSEINETLRQIEQDKALIAEKRAEIARRQTGQEQYEDGVSELVREKNAEINSRRNEISAREEAIREYQKEDAFIERQQKLYEEQREFLDKTYERQAAGEIKQGRNGIVEEIQQKESAIQSEIDVMRTELNNMKAPKKGLFESKEKFARRQSEYNARRTRIEEEIKAKEYEKAEWGELRETAENSTQNYVREDLNNALYRREVDARYNRQQVQDNIAAKQSEIEGLNRDIEVLEAERVNTSSTAEQVRTQYEAETQRLNQEIESLGRKIDMAEESVRVLSREQGVYRENLSRTNRSINEKRAQLESLKKETNPDRVKIKQLEEELADLRANHDAYQAKYNELNTKLTQKRAKLEKIKKSYAKKQEKIKTVHKAGGAFLGGVVGTQALQEAGRTADQIKALIAAMAMDEGEELTEEDLAIEDDLAEEDAVSEEGDEVSEEESVDEESVSEETVDDASSDTTPDTTPGSDQSSNNSSNNSSQSGDSGSKPVNNNNGNKPVDNNGGKDPVNNDNNPVHNNDNEDPSVDDDNSGIDISNNAKEGITLQTYVTGRSNDGTTREITPAERMIITQQIQDANTMEDIALIYTELRSFKKFDGRKNIRKALKQKRKMLEEKKNNYYERMGKIKDSKVYQSDNSTVTDNDRQTVQHNTTDIGDVTVGEKKRPFFRKIFGGGDYNPYLETTGETPERITLETPAATTTTVISEGQLSAPATDGTAPVVQAGTDPAAVTGGETTPERPPMYNDKGEMVPPEQVEEYLQGGGKPYDANGQEITLQPKETAEIDIHQDLTANFFASSDGMLADAPEVPVTEPEETPQDLIAQADTQETAPLPAADSEDEEPKHRLDIGDGWGIA